MCKHCGILSTRSSQCHTFPGLEQFLSDHGFVHFFFEAVVEAVPADPRPVPGTTQRSRCGRTTRATWRHHHVERRRRCRRRRCTSASSKGSPSGFEPDFIPVLLDEGPFQSFGFDPIAPLDRSHWEDGQDLNLRCFQQQQHVLRETAHQVLSNGLANAPYVTAVRVEEDQMPCVGLEKDKVEKTPCSYSDGGTLCAMGGSSSVSEKTLSVTIEQMIPEDSGALESRLWKAHRVDLFRTFALNTKVERGV